MLKEKKENKTSMTSNGNGQRHWFNYYRLSMTFCVLRQTTIKKVKLTISSFFTVFYAGLVVLICKSSSNSEYSLFHYKILSKRFLRQLCYRIYTNACNEDLLSIAVFYIHNLPHGDIFQTRPV